MGDIFISYSRDDRSKAEELARYLEQYGWSVWWDREIPVGKKYAQIIAQELAEAKAVLVLWSQSSVASDWVKDEAQEGVNRGILIPVLIEDVGIPFGFRQHQAANLSDWDGSASHPELEMLLEGISKTINHPQPVAVVSRRITKSNRVPLIAGAAAVVLLAVAVIVFMNFNRAAVPEINNQARGNRNNRFPVNRNAPGDQAARDRAIRFTVEAIDKASSGNYEGAILMYNAAVEADPGYEDAYFYRGQSFVVTKQIRKAVADFRKVLELDPDDERQAKVEALLKDIQNPPLPPAVRTTAPASDAVRAQVGQMFSSSKVLRIESTTKLITANRQDPKAMSLAISAAKADPNNKSGVINTLVLLENMDPAILREHRQEIDELLKLVQGNGPDTQEHIKKVRALMRG